MNKITEDLYEFENYCMNCDNFPGDNTYDIREYNGPICPFREKFLTGIFNGNTEWKKINCNKFMD